MIATGRIMATVIPGSIQSNRDRSELVALRRLGTVEDCAKVIEFLATELSEYRRASSPTAVQREKARKLQAALDAAAPVAAVSAEEAAARGTPAHGFADTLPM